MALEITPTFLLKGIDVKSLLTNYNSAHLSGYSFDKKKLEVTTIGISNSYVFRNKDNFTINLVFSNTCKLEEKICRYCCLRFTHQSIGIPIAIHEENNSLIVTTTKVSCDFRCSLSLIRQYKRRQNKDTNFIHSEQMLRYIFAGVYPGKELIEAPDPDLAAWNGGSLSLDEYKNEKFIYTPCNNIIMRGYQAQYIRQKL